MEIISMITANLFLGEEVDGHWLSDNADIADAGQHITALEMKAAFCCNIRSGF